MILDGLDYGTSSFKGFVTKYINNVTWFLQSSAGPIIDDSLVSGGRVLGGIAHAHRTSKAHFRLHVDTL